jgi:hypothetical protein
MEVLSAPLEVSVFCQMCFCFCPLSPALFCWGGLGWGVNSRIYLILLTTLQDPENKIKKTATGKLTIDLQLNPDLLTSVTARSNPPFTVGFAAETENMLENAVKKLVQKKPIW